MRINDARGRDLQEVTIQLSPDEITELMVAASEIEEGSKDHALLRDGTGTGIAIYRNDTVAEPLPKGTDWWLGPVILVGVVLLLVGAFTIAQGLINLFL